MMTSALRSIIAAIRGVDVREMTEAQMLNLAWHEFDYQHTAAIKSALVGDGINDTLALAAATVGIAMSGAGSPQAMETADIALMADDLTQLPGAVRLSRFARRLIGQNILLSFGVKIVFLLLALFGLTALWVAILADMGMSLLVTLNGMRPLTAAGSDFCQRFIAAEYVR